MSAVLDQRKSAAVGVQLPRPAYLDEVIGHWQALVIDPALSNLPYKIETNRSGQIVMSPAKTQHSIFQGKLAAVFERALGDLVMGECAIATREGIKVADVAWCSPKRYEKIRGPGVLLYAPEICVEIKSPSNASPELAAKIRLYLDSGAREVWVVSEDGAISIHSAAGQVQKSSFKIKTPLLRKT